MFFIQIPDYRLRPRFENDFIPNDRFDFVLYPTLDVLLLDQSERFLDFRLLSVDKMVSDNQQWYPGFSKM